MQLSTKKVDMCVDNSVKARADADVKVWLLFVLLSVNNKVVNKAPKEIVSI